MKRIIIKAAQKKDSSGFLSLVDALADFEKLRRPTRAARLRLIRDGFGPGKRFQAYLAFSGGQAVGYAIIFETYSSFLALPTLYLEDIFVLPEHRKEGVGMKLFRKCLTEALERGCGRMEWVVLDWNKNAVRFYDRLGARHLAEWLPYRIEHSQFKGIIRGTRSPVQAEK